MKCLLSKTLYGLKQSPREWNKVMSGYLISNGFKQSEADPCIYTKREKDEVLFVGIYVDDIISIGKGRLVTDFRAAMNKHFNMTSGGKLDWYLGVAFDRLADGTMELNQKQYLKSKLDEFADFIGEGVVSTPLPLSHKTPNERNIENDIEPGFPYRAMVGRLMYAMLGTRPDLSVAVSTLSKYLDNPTKDTL